MTTSRNAEHEDLNRAAEAEASKRTAYLSQPGDTTSDVKCCSQQMQNCRVGIYIYFFPPYIYKYQAIKKVFQTKKKANLSSINPRWAIKRVIN